MNTKADDKKIMVVVDLLILFISGKIILQLFLLH